jgi:23S rRNA pseudouridine1911/1915/1917 synthase
VPQAAGRLRLDLALIAQNAGLSRRKARDVIEKGQVTVNGALVREPGLLVAPTAVLSWDPNRKSLPRARLSLPLLHHDEALLIVDKPAGLLSVPSAPELAATEDTALARVQDYVRHLTPRHPYVGIVHRIDRETSGTLAFTLTPEARDAVRTLFREHRIERRYAALVQGSPRGETGLVDAPIRDTYEMGRRGVARPDEPSRAALTRWTVRERFRGAALLDISIETGRQHQIRAHLAHVGLPVLGDTTYRSRNLRPAPIDVRRHMLHAQLLAFVHPLSGRPVRAESPLPDDFRKALTALRRMSAEQGKG